MRKTTVWGGVLLAGAILATMVVRADDDKPSYTIKEIMKKAHSAKTNLPKKLILGQISDREKTKLIDYYEALGNNKPPKGSAEDWQKRTSTLLTAAKAALDGGQPEKAKFRKAVDCKSCHDAHKATDD
jgi:hypothetical protein